MRCTAANLPLHLAVWALRPCGVETDRGLKVVEAPANTNPNLNAQSGLFTLLTTTENLSVDGFYEQLHRERGIFLVPFGALNFQPIARVRFSSCCGTRTSMAHPCFPAQMALCARWPKPFSGLAKQWARPLRDELKARTVCVKRST